MRTFRREIHENQLQKLLIQMSLIVSLCFRRKKLGFLNNVLAKKLSEYTGTFVDN